MQKKTYIFITIGILILFGIISFFLTSSQSDTVSTELESEFTNLPSADSTPAEQPPIATTDGFRDLSFLQDPDVTNWFDDETTYLLDEAASADGEVYQIFFFTIDNSIGIALLDENLAFARALAERALVDRLGLPLTDICELPISVSTPRTVSESMSGIELGLTFCPNAVTL